MPLSSDLQNKTILQAEDKSSIIEHLNEEQQLELINFAQMALSAESNVITDVIEQVSITQLYHQGMELLIKRADIEPMTVFIPFPETITNMEQLLNQYIALKQQADKRLGKDSIKVTEQKFVVQSKHRISGNMLRLLLSVDESVMRYAQSPGYAYLFDITTNAARLQQQLAREHCYYTLRKVSAASVSTNLQTNNQRATAWVDVYLHADKTTNTLTSGGLWASALQPGQQVRSKREFPERIEHLQQGQALLIADETSLPTVARLLELWQNPLAPLVICITNDATDQDYLNDAHLSECAKGLTVLPLVIDGNQDNLAERIDAVVAEFLAEQALSAPTFKIDKVWGALEAKVSKKLRRLLSKRLTLSRTDCVIKVYWRAD